jgi:hypothetical protein
MNKPHSIIAFGANGNGKINLARELAQILVFKFMGIEKHAFAESGIHTQSNALSIANKADSCNTLWGCELNCGRARTFEACAFNWAQWF